jgi:hypothetical protein
MLVHHYFLFLIFNTPIKDMHIYNALIIIPSQVPVWYS